VIRGVVLAAILWGASDLTLLFIDIGHDVRAARVLLGRMSARATSERGERSAERGERGGVRDERLVSREGRV
jgi:Sec-independent protein translocase protein TatA